MLNLRSGLDAQAQENLRVQLEALLAGELSEEAWLKNISLIAEARRAADRHEQTRLKK
jgi:hypothetical protein